MHIDNQGGRVTSQQAAIIAAGQSHDFCASRDNAFIVADIAIDSAPQLERLPAFINLDPALRQYVGFLCQQLKDNPVSQSSQQQILLLLLQLLQERFGQALKIDRRIVAAQTYIEQNLHHNLTLEQLAKAAHLSPRQLNTLFQHQLGISPKQYVIEKRMQHAWRLLETSDLNIQQVANQVGYSSLASFSDRFRKHFNRPPSYFRKIDK